MRTELFVACCLLAACRTDRVTSVEPEPNPAPAVESAPGAAAPSATQASEPSATAKAEPAPVCDTVEACVKLGNGRMLVRDYETSLAARRHACELSPQECWWEGKMVLEGLGTPADPAGLDKIQVSCDAGRAESCTEAAVILASGEYGIARDLERALSTSRAGCELGAGASCHNAAFILQQPELAAKARPREVERLVEKACSLGEAEDCRAIEQAKPAKLASIPGANITMGEASADGQRIAEISCKVDRAPLFGSLALVGALAKQKKAFDRCAPKGDAVVVEWTSKNGRVSQATAKLGQSPKVDQCIATALRKVQSPMDSTCAAVLLVGNTTQADQRLAALRSP